MSDRRNAIRTDLERRAWRAMITYAVMRWESAVVIAMTIVLTFLFTYPFPWWPWWGWPALGLVAEALIVWTSLMDVRTGERVVAEMFREEFDPGAIHDRELRAQVERALEYRARMETLVHGTPAGVLRDRLEATIRGVQDWMRNIYRLARRLDRYHGDKVIHEDLESVPAALKHLELRLRQEDDPAVREQLQEAIRGRQTQWEVLERLQNTMERAEAQLEATVAALATVYAQLQLISARKAEGSEAERVAASIRDEVAALQDIVAAMDEVYRTEGTRGN
jgi:head-tail adaptor